MNQSNDHAGGMASPSREHGRHFGKAAPLNCYARGSTPRGAAVASTSPEPGKQQHQKNQIDGSRTDDDSEPRTHRVASAIPISPNVSMMASPPMQRMTFRCTPSGDWKTVSQNLSENCRHRVSDSLSIAFMTPIQIMPAIIGFLSANDRAPALTVPRVFRRRSITRTS